MKYFYLNVQFGYSVKDNNQFANIMIQGHKMPTDRRIKQELNLLGLAKKPIRNLEYFCYCTE